MTTAREIMTAGAECIGAQETVLEAAKKDGDSPCLSGLLDMLEQADGPGSVAGQRPGPEPAVGRLVGFGRFGMCGQLTLDLQCIGQTAFLKATRNSGFAP